ncbi:hypothetical protein [Rhizobium leguminosarum]|uniref:hypothetical protein n=1 Tax=Rhizobium leguminosarum TaxID=384 RepID=UPI0014417528|nr:hypothetical protein [Rhizobium leguminosarum]NKL63310.1 hypothetical protein [Rhizobium leguminosarum bv. viciae]
MDEDELGKPAVRDIQIEGVDGAFDYVGYVSRKQLDDDQTKEMIADLQKRGVVTIVDGKTGLSMEAVAYKASAQQLDWGARYPYDDPEDSAPAVDWAHASVRGILNELRDLPGIKHYMDDIDVATRVEIVQGLADVVRAAFIRRAALSTRADRHGDVDIGSEIPIVSREADNTTYAQERDPESAFPQPYGTSAQRSESERNWA